MPLVYLDNSHLWLLEMALKEKPEDFDRFADRLRSVNASLALGMSHLFEISRSAFGESRQYRFEVFKRLTPIYCAVPSEPMLRAGLHDLHRRELASVLGLFGDRSRSGRFAAFPHILDRNEVGEICSAFESDDMRATNHLFDTALSAFAELENTNPRVSGDRRLRDYPEVTPTELTEEMASQLLDSVPSFAELFKDNPEFLRFMELMPTEQRAALEQKTRQDMRELMTRMRTEGPRKVMADIAGADSTDKSVVRQTVDEAMVRSRLKHETLAIVSRFRDSSEAEAAANSIRLEDCPARWLSFQIEREIERAEPEAKPSNAYDSMHVSHLPYVDLLFTDKRISTYVEQVRRRHAAWPSWAQMGRAVRVSQSIDALIDPLDLLN